MTWDSKRHNEVKARCEKATMGPWTVRVNTYELNELGRETFGEKAGGDTENMIVTEWTHPLLKGPQRIIAIGYSPFYEGGERTLYIQDADAEFMAASRTDLPDALAEIERLQGQVDRLTRAVRVFSDDAEVIEFNDEAYVVNVLKPKLDNLYAVIQSIDTAINQDGVTND